MEVQEPKYKIKQIVEYANMESRNKFGEIGRIHTEIHWGTNYLNKGKPTINTYYSVGLSERVREDDIKRVLAEE